MALRTALVTIAATVAVTNGKTITVTNTHCALPTVLPSTYDNGQSIFLPWVKPWESLNRSTPSVEASIEGGPKQALPVDTGSTGILHSASSLPSSLFTLTVNESADVFQFLSSSARLYVGKRVPVHITFFGQDGATADAEVNVLAVQKLVVCPWYNVASGLAYCPPRPPGEMRNMTEGNVDGIAYMGVGFGRGGDGQEMATPGRNAFLNIVKISSPSARKRIDAVTVESGRRLPSKIHEGYLLSTIGVTLGLTTTNTKGFRWENLKPNRAVPGDWQMASAGFALDQTSIGGVSTCVVDPSCSLNGTILVDIGVPQMYIHMPSPNIVIPNTQSLNPANPALGTIDVLPNGTKIRISLPCGGTDPSSCDPRQVMGSYTFEVGSKSSSGERKMEPLYARPLAFNATSGAFVNTGRNFLEGFDVGFDAEGGRFGIRGRWDKSAT